MIRPSVYLIGTGPGDAGLITVLGLDRLRDADVVVYDHLVPTRLLKHARPGAELIDVGASAPQPMALEAISYLLLEKAREGKVIARLKWGDPFVFDRGGEEALFLHENVVPFEVVPGIPAGLGVPAYAGIPVTYPGGGNTITLVRGHEDESRSVPDVDWASLAKIDGTVICYVGAQQLLRVLDAMAAGGFASATPAVAIYNGTLPTQESVTGTITTLTEILRQGPRRRDAAILVVGRVAALREHLRWYDSRPLFGKRVLVTRPREQAAAMVDRLTAYGAQSVEVPMIRLAPPEDPSPLLDAAARVREFDWIVFTSANAVDSFMTALLDGVRDIRSLAGPRLCTTGAATAAKLASFGIKVDLVPAEFSAEAAAAAILAEGPVAGHRVLLPRADIGREIIADRLRAGGATVSEVVAYRTVIEDAQRPGDPDVYGMLLNGQIDVATFTSPSAIRNFVRLYGEEQTADLLKHTIVATIGPVTADAARDLGVDVTIQPATHTVPALVDAIAAHFATRQQPSEH